MFISSAAFPDIKSVQHLRLWIMIFTAFLVTLFWDTPFFWPVKMLNVLIHEMWHGLSALIAGASLDHVTVNSLESGETFVTNLDGIIPFVFSVSAGYLGTTITGGYLLNRGLADKGVRLSLAVFSFVLLYMSYLFTVPFELAFFLGIFWGGALLFLSFLPQRIAGSAIVILGTLFVLYSVFDLFDFTSEVEKTDAGILSAFLIKNGLLGFPEISQGGNFISILWSLFMALILFLFLRPARFAQKPALIEESVNNEKDKNESDPPPEDLLQDFPAEEVLALIELRKQFELDKRSTT